MLWTAAIVSGVQAANSEGGPKLFKKAKKKSEVPPMRVKKALSPVRPNHIAIPEDRHKFWTGSREYTTQRLMVCTGSQLSYMYYRTVSSYMTS